MSDEIKFDFEQLHKDGDLPTFIEELEAIRKQQDEMIARHEHKRFLSAVIGKLQVDALELDNVLLCAKRYRDKVK